MKANLNVLEPVDFVELILLQQTADIRNNHYLSFRKHTAALPKAATFDSAI